MTRISEEDFDAWRENAITRAVFAHLKEMQIACETAWVNQLRAEVAADPRVIQLLQVELNSKSTIIEDMLTIELGDIQEDEQQGATEVTPIRGAKRR